LILRRGGLLVAVGLVAGLGGAAALTGLLRALLFGVPPLDLVTFVVSGLAIVVVGLVAASVPALRAARIDPVGALRSE
jgi:putative ABC transport system permease protein